MSKGLLVDIQAQMEWLCNGGTNLHARLELRLCLQAQGQKPIMNEEGAVKQHCCQLYEPWDA